MPVHKNQIADLEKLLRNTAGQLGIELRTKSLLPYQDERGNAHYLLPDLIYEDGDVKIAIEIGGEYSDRTKPEHQRQKEAALRQLGFTVIYFDLEASDQTEIETFAKELQRLISQKKGASSIESADYLTGSVQLGQKLAAKITERRQGKTEAPPTISSPNKEVTAPEAERPPVPDPIDHQGLVTNPRAESNPVPALSTKKHFHFLASAMIGAAAFSLALIGVWHLPFFSETDLVREFSADLLGSTELEFTLPEGTFALPAGTVPALTNPANRSSVFSVHIILPPYTELIRYQNTYLLRCTADAQKVIGENACALK